MVNLTQDFTLQRRGQSSISATVLTDISESMAKALAIARDSWQWMSASVIRSDDHVAFLDFDDGLVTPDRATSSSAHLTRLYDCLMQLIPQTATNETGRRALILFTDGNDNYSLHSLQQVIELAVQTDVAIYAITLTSFTSTITRKF